MKIRFTILALFFALLLIKAQTQPEMLIIFHQGEKESDFTQKKLVELSSYLQTMAIPIQLLDIRQTGMVEKVKTTPAIFYQNHQGRYFYKGRYTSFDKIANFVRTNRVIAPAKIEYNSPNTLVFTQQRMRLMLELKITPIQGRSVDTVDFQPQAERAIIQMLQKQGFRLEKELLVTGSFLKFYFDFHPFISPEGLLYVSYALFSQHDCINPIFISNPIQLQGQKKREKAFAAAAQSMSVFLKKELTVSQLGDAATPAPLATQIKTWEELGFNLPLAPADKNNTVIAPNLPLPQNWTYLQSSIANAPALTFNFAPPAQQYAGEVKEIKGSLRLGENATWSGTKGEFVVNTRSVTMGLQELDELIYTKLLQTDLYPEAKLLIVSIKSNTDKIQLGQTQNLEIAAVLSIKNIAIPITATAQADCYMDKDKNLQISLHAQFMCKTVDKTLNIEVPAAPAAEKGNLIFNVNIALRPETRP